MPEPRSVELTDPRALRALAHPTRLALLALLRSDGPHTATSAGARLGESSGSCSFHLRQLARYGLVEETGEGTGRNKPWRATADFTQVPTIPADREQRAAGELLSGVIVEQQNAALLDWVRRRADEPEEWQRAGDLGDALLHLTAEELTEFQERVWDEAMRFLRPDPAERPAGSRPVRYFRIAYPTARPDGDGD
jgi:predicted ArsR family transcriptional regulator